ncbi:hypothetical protein [Thalassotalea fusca]
MNRMFSVVKLLGTILIVCVSLYSKASLIGDDICFSAMQGQGQQITVQDCDTIVVRDPAPSPPQPIDIEIVALQLVSAAPVPIPNAPDSFFDIFVDIDIQGEAMMFEFYQQPTVCEIDCPQIPPDPWELWFEDLDWWLDPFLGIPMDGYITGLWLMWGDSPDQMIDITSFGGLPGLGFFFGPHEIHSFIDIFNLMSEFNTNNANDLPTFKLAIHTHHDIPEPSILMIAGIALLMLARVRIKS